MCSMRVSCILTRSRPLGLVWPLAGANAYAKLPLTFMWPGKTCANVLLIP
jgi:hypothetical protein